MIKIIVLWLLCSAVALHAQIPVEVFGGHEKTTLDIMWFRFFKNRNRENSPWLFFNRNRASVDYRMYVAEGAFLPQFGFQRRFWAGRARISTSPKALFLYGAATWAVCAPRVLTLFFPTGFRR